MHDAELIGISVLLLQLPVYHLIGSSRWLLDSHTTPQARTWPTSQLRDVHRTAPVADLPAIADGRGLFQATVQTQTSLSSWPISPGVALWLVVVWSVSLLADC